MVSILKPLLPSLAGDFTIDAGSFASTAHLAWRVAIAFYLPFSKFIASVEGSIALLSITLQYMMGHLDPMLMLFGGLGQVGGIAGGAWTMNGDNVQYVNCFN